MALLKKIPASTLMETLVATVLIVLVFMASSMILNNLFANSMRQDQNNIRQELLHLQYNYQNGLLEIPYQTRRGDWTIEVNSKRWHQHTQLIYRARHTTANLELVIKQ
ncbi:hypothetical protein [Flagellimonas meridianipacifica]|uniref:Prepilin-type N-terminal cleavage/methylation domain-containing protein n=1 Tax=Flagellimonas meridianipacifica TaxID=1080225 RepID=A0A2T0MHY8_9FLAO|nr:hypothetical protein [Allomuricauda pacifica]PRX57189.1 hypothetical protein CLV81_1192 [Allomuricauda pacifica]